MYRDGEIQRAMKEERMTNKDTVISYLELVTAMVKKGNSHRNHHQQSDRRRPFGGGDRRRLQQGQKEQPTKWPSYFII